MPRLLLLLSLCCLSVRAHAQAFEPGWLLPASGDTLRGLVQNDYWSEPPNVVYFRAAPDSAVRKFGWRTVRAFGLASGRYFRFEVLPYDHAAVNRVEQLPHGNKVNVRADSLLAEVLVDGPASLLFVGTRDTDHYLVQRPGHAPIDLSERRYLRQTTRGWGVADGNNYHNQLDALFADCPAALAAAARAPFTAEALGAVVQTYNQACEAGQQPGRSYLQPNTSRQAVAWQMGAVVVSPFFSSKATLDPTLVPMLGIYGEALQANRRVAPFVQATFGYSHQSESVALDSTQLVTYGVNAAARNTHTFSRVYTDIQLGIRYFAPSKSRTRFMAGVMFDTYLVLPRHTISLTSTFNNATTTLPSSVVGAERLDKSIPLAGLFLTTGLRHQRFSLAADVLIWPHDGFFLLGRGWLAYRLTRAPGQVKLPAD